MDGKERGVRILKHGRAPHNFVVGQLLMLKCCLAAGHPPQVSLPCIQKPKKTKPTPAPTMSLEASLALKGVEYLDGLTPAHQAIIEGLWYDRVMAESHTMCLEGYISELYRAETALTGRTLTPLDLSSLPLSRRRIPASSTDPGPSSPNRVIMMPRPWFRRLEGS